MLGIFANFSIGLFESSKSQDTIRRKNSSKKFVEKIRRKNSSKNIPSLSKRKQKETETYKKNRY